MYREKEEKPPTSRGDREMAKKKLKRGLSTENESTERELEKENAQ